MVNLQILNYTDNFVVGPLPTTIGDLMFLVEYAANINSHDGTIPTEVGQMVGLLTLRLNDNMLEGTIPAEIGNLQTIGRSVPM